MVGCACDSLDRCTCGAAYLARRGAETLPRPTLLHVTNGESAGNTLRRTSLGGAVLPWQDVLHEGPVPSGARRDLLRARAAFLSECGWGSRRAILSALERRDRQVPRGAAETGARVVLWFEHDLYDQLQLLDALALAGEVGGAPELIVVGSFVGKANFHGLGELTPDELETLWPTRAAAASEAVADATDAWTALCAPDPVALADCARGGSRDLPVPRSGASPAARGAPRACRRPVGDGTTRTPGRGGRRGHSCGGVRRRAGARGGAVHRRRLVLQDAHETRFRPCKSRRDPERRAATATAATRRRPRIRLAPSPADTSGNGGACG